MTTITFDAVSAVADALVEEGQKTTLANVRSALGGGSFSTISPLLKQWRESKTAVVATAPIVEPAPAEIGVRVDALASEIWHASIALANARLTADREALEQTRIALESERDEAAELADLLQNDLESVTAERDALQLALDAAQGQLSESQSQCQQQAEKIAEDAQALKDAHAATMNAQARADELAGLLKTEQAARSALDVEVSKLHERVEEWTSTASTFKAQHEASEKANAALRGQIDGLSKANADLQAQMDVLSKANTELRSNIAQKDSEIVAANTRAESTSARLVDATSAIEKFEKSLEAARKETADAGKVAARLEGRIAELEKQLVAARQVKNSTVSP